MSTSDNTGDHVVRLSRTLSAPPERVWRALTDQRALTAWYWPAALRPEVTTDVRVGGRYRIAAAAAPMAVSGEYTEVEPSRRLVLRWRWDGEDRESLVTIELAGGARTDLRLTHDGLDARAAPLHRQGWSDCLDRLPGYLADEGRPAAGS